MSEVVTKLLAQLDAVLGPDGVFTNQFGSTYNADQHEYARRVLNGFFRVRAADGAAGVNMLQAATGTGKTIGYLVPACLHSAETGSRVHVSTFTRHLQHQILTRDADTVYQMVEQITGKKLKISRRVGRRNYLSRSGCEDLLEHIRVENTALDSEEAVFMVSLMEWITSHDDVALVLDDFLYRSDEDPLHMPSSIDRALITISASSPDHEIEQYKDHVATTHQSDILITNHSLTILNAYRWSSILDGDRKADILICDEADRLSDAAESIMTADMSLRRFSSICSSLPESVNSQDLVRAANDLEQLVSSIKANERSVAVMPPVVKIEVSQAVETITPVAKRCAKLLMKHAFSDMDKEVVSEFVDSVADLVRISNSANDKSNICLVSWSPVKEYPSLRIGKTDPARMITRLLTPLDRSDEPTDLDAPRFSLSSCLFTSATLGTPGMALPMAFDAFSRTIGVIRHFKAGSQRPIHNVCTELFKIFEPKKFGSMEFVLADPSITSPVQKVTDKQMEEHVRTSPEWLSYSAAMIRAAAMKGERVMVLTLSFSDTKALAALLADVNGLIEHRRGQSLSSALEGFKNTPGTVLITPSGWEGVDLPGLIKHLVITRIPYTPPDGFQSTINEIVYRERGMSEDKINRLLFGLTMEATRRKLSQGIGRGIRKATDKVMVWLPDPRMPFPTSFLTSLDPVLMGADTSRQNKQMSSCIPQRFEASFNDASLFLKNGELYKPMVF